MSISFDDLVRGITEDRLSVMGESVLPKFSSSTESLEHMRAILSLKQGDSVFLQREGVEELMPCLFVRLDEGSARAILVTCRPEPPYNPAYISVSLLAVRLPASN